MAEPPSKRLKSSNEGKANNVVPASSSKSAVQDFFSGVKAHIIDNGLGKTRASILADKLTKHGGKHHKRVEKDTTHIVFAKSIKVERVAKLVGLEDKTIPEGVILVWADWLSKCLTENKLVSLQQYLPRVSGTTNDNATKLTGDDSRDSKTLDNDDSKSVQVSVTERVLNTGEESKPEKKHDAETSHTFEKKLDKGESDSDFVDSGDEQESSKITSKCSPEKTKGTWICAAPSTSKGINQNQHITEKLQVLATSYANTKDQWRALGYKKAIASIKSYHKKIETWEECSKLPFVGEKLAKKIWEIVETGHLRRLDHIDPKIEAINLFADVWGAGPKTAEIWVSKGLRTLEDLKKDGNLNKQLQIGLKYFEEFRERMPREEAGKIGEQVQKAAEEVDPGLVCETCGSYRRGKPTCGDVDVLISHPDGKSHYGVMQKILENLKSTGFVTDDLVSIHNLEQNKYMGVCKLPGNDAKHRRLDIIVVPYNEWACAIVYFTGSDYFNRSARLLAKKNGMSLSEKSLNTGVIRQGGEKVFEGTPLPVFSEKDIFKYLGLEYREPVERDW